MSNWVIVPTDEDLQHGKYLKKILPNKKKVQAGTKRNNEWARWEGGNKNAIEGSSVAIKARNEAIEKRKTRTGKPRPNDSDYRTSAEKVVDKAKTKALIAKKKKESAGKAKKKNPNARTR